MRKAAFVFVLVVFVPSLALAWLASSSLRSQQLVIERQQSLLYQGVTEALANSISDHITQLRHDFNAQLDSLLEGALPYRVAAEFDDKLREKWPLADVGFCVTTAGVILSPSPGSRAEAKFFCLDNGGFLGNRESVVVYTESVSKNAAVANINIPLNNAISNVKELANSTVQPVKGSDTELKLQPNAPKWANNRIGNSGFLGNSASVPPNADFGNRNSAVANNSTIGLGNSIFKTAGNANSSPGKDSQIELKLQLRPEAGNSSANRFEAAGLFGNGPNLALNSEGEGKNPAAPNNGTLANGDSTLKETGNANPQVTKEPQSDSKPQLRTVKPLSNPGLTTSQENSKIIPAEAEFHQLIGEERDGTIARFLRGKLKLLFWRRSSSDSQLLFGAQLNLGKLIESMRGLMRVDPNLNREICVALLDDKGSPVALSRPGFRPFALNPEGGHDRRPDWKHPFVASEIGEALPHWEIAAYLLNPAKVSDSATVARLTLALLIAVLVLAIGVGSWLVFADVNRQLVLTRQKNDFVSNVSHELKTPLTSIRMFSELLAEGKVSDPAKQRSYLHIISAESARLTRLINNVLDFARLERGEKKYDFKICNLIEVVSETVESYRPHLESIGFFIEFRSEISSLSIRGDCDALSQVVVNLLSNAEKYSDGSKQIEVRIVERADPVRHAEVQILDRGIGIPRGSEERIFEQFYRAHDSLNSGVQGSGLGLTLARQIARAHGGDVSYRAREGGGSCFALCLPVCADANA